MGVSRTFGDNPLLLEQSIVDIRQLLDEPDRSEEDTGCSEYFSD